MGRMVIMFDNNNYKFIRPSEFNSWEPLKNLENIMEMVYEFEAELREKRKS